MIEIKNVSIGYDGKRVIKSCNITLPSKGITVLVGPNGAGKSTLLSGIGRLLPLEKGEVLIEGKNIDNWKNEDLAKKMAILRQNNNINMRLTVSELALLGRYPHCKGKYKDEDMEIVEKSLEQVNMTSMANDYIDEISGGQRQRAFIAMTLSQDAKYLLLDEPLSALDMRHSRDMLRHLHKISREKDVSIIIVIHDINMASAYADYMVALKDDMIISHGKVEDVIKEEVLSNIFDCKVNVNRVGKTLCAMPEW